MELQMALMHFVEDLGVQVIAAGGTRPDHIQQLAEIAQTLKPKERQPNYESCCVNLQRPALRSRQFLIVGERLNASGSKSAANC